MTPRKPQPPSPDKGSDWPRKQQSSTATEATSVVCPQCAGTGRVPMRETGPSPFDQMTVVERQVSQVLTTERRAADALSVGDMIVADELIFTVVRRLPGYKKGIAALILRDSDGRMNTRLFEERRTFLCVPATVLTSPTSRGLLDAARASGVTDEEKPKPPKFEGYSD
jgi:hypothetical protein